MKKSFAYSLRALDKEKLCFVASLFFGKLCYRSNPR
jgi:hypothetical protein